MTAKLDWTSVPATRLADPDLAAAWDALNAGRGNLPFLAADAMTLALQVFGRGEERLLIGRDAGGVAAMLLLRRSGTGRWQTFQPSQIPLGAWVAAPGIQPVDLARALLQRPLGAALALSLTPLDPLHAGRGDDGASWTHADHIETGWIDVTGSFEDYWAARGKNLRSNLRKQRNRLAADGVACEFAEFRAEPEMAAAIARYGALESAGWKGREGTAIHPGNAQGRFYRGLFEAAARRGEAVVHECRFDGRTVASNLSLERDGVLVILKTTYDESLDKALSPAFLLHHDQLERLFAERRVRRVEYYGRFMEWHSRWTDSRRTLHHLTCYRWAWLKQLKGMKRGAPAGATAPTAG